MIAEQLQAARAAHWRQKQNPILTLEDAQGWLEQHPLCLYLPRKAQLPAPAPSFVEACLGSREATPGAASIAQAQGLLARLIASGTVAPLNLLGGVGEQPDFLATIEALPYVLALRADADWKHAPQKSSGHKVSPLVLELWKVLDTEGALTAAEARETLGRELTEAAVLRALCELWQALRISPVPAEGGQPPRWEMLRVRHQRALETGSTTSQVTALSLLVSMYLQSVYAASSEEIEIFLSPVASRSRVREAVRGLSATRQIHSLSMDAQTYYFLENGLPEFAEPATPSAPAETAARQPLTVARPKPRKMQATAGPDLPAAPAASAPIFRRPKPAPATAPKPAPGPERGPLAKPAQPAARAGWKTPARPGSPGRPAWKPRPPAGGARWAQKDEGMRSEGKPRPASGSRPPFVPGRSANRPYVRPGAAGQTARPAARPDARGGAGKRETPAPWALPGRKSGSGPRPPRAGGRGDSPFRPAQKYRPGTGSGREGAPPFPPRAPRGERGPAGRPGTPPAYRANRSPVPYRSNQARSGAAQGARPSGSRPGARPGSRSGPRPAGKPGFDQPGRPFPRAAGPTGPRPTAAEGSGARAKPRPNYDRPRPAGFARPGGKPAPGGGGKGRGDRAPRPPFVPGSKPAKSGPGKSWPRAGGPGAKPGKPSFRGRKPDRKKPGA